MGSTPPPQDAVASSTPNRNECPICKKKFDRKDHLARHVASHTNTRGYACPRCPKRFNRRDLLSRHLANHNIHSSSHGTSHSRPRGHNRASQACEACVKAKAKCSNQRPCPRCQSRGTECRDGSTQKTTAAIPSGVSDVPGVPGVSHVADVDSTMIDDIHEPEPPVAVPHTPSTDFYHTLWNFAASTNRSTGEGEYTVLPFGMPDFMGHDHPPLDPIYWENFNLAPTDLLGMGQDMDFSFDNTIQGNDSLALSEPPVRSLPALSPATSAHNASSPQSTQSSQSRPRRLSDAVARTGHRAYLRSPWLFNPVAQDHAYAESQALSVDEQQLAQSPEVRQLRQLRQGRQFPTSSTIPRPMDTAARDAILSMALQFSKATASIGSFPSCDLLNILMQAYFVREASRKDPWIHTATFRPDQCRTELLVALVASGSMLFSAAKVWKMGLALQEVVKLAVRSAVDNDNRVTRDLQLSQAFLLWVEIALWSGHRRKMEIGEGFASSIITMLRRSGTFRQGYYAPLPSLYGTQNDDERAQAWHKWVRQQSFRRLVLHMFMTEMRASIAFSRSPIMSVAELSFTLPAGRNLWDAPNAQEWKSRYRAKQTKDSSLTIVDGMYNASQLASELDNIDMGLASLAVLYGFWCPVWAYIDARAASHLANGTPGSSSFSRASPWEGATRRHELCESIHTASLKLRSMNALCPEGQLVSEFLMMSLHVYFEDMQRFAGRYGVDEFKQALPRLQAWAQSHDQYAAAWHAGQVLRAARSSPPTHLRGFPAVAVYQACLTLFVFAVFAKYHAPLVQEQPLTTMNTDNNTSWPAILLDGEETMDVRTYLRTGQGRPRLMMSGQAEYLDNPVMIGTVMAETLRGNYPAKARPLPPLLDSLINLMDEICTAFVAE